jgi:hypothetical protein
MVYYGALPFAIINVIPERKKLFGPKKLNLFNEKNA